MGSERTDLVTGAFGFSGRSIARQLLARGIAVRTLTDHPPRGRDPEIARAIEAFPYAFDEPGQLEKSFEGVHTFYNTYWVRFDHGTSTYVRAISNTRALFQAAKRAGVQRIVHTSIANPGAAPDLAYYSGKLELERDLEALGLPFAILRPTVLFGQGGILINNIAWLLRHLPVFAVAGSGAYRLQPVHVDDMARLALLAAERSDDYRIDAVGPEVYSFVDLVRLIRDAIGARTWIVRVPLSVGYALARGLGLLLRDALITRAELVGLERELLVSDHPPTCPTRLSEWLRGEGRHSGERYLSELALHYRRAALR